ncbi:MAG: polyprenyl synthetase family protein [Candidatus Omnitrophota bacterium]|nr:polyprenyl synthetase family protein [Candidatus Omnitrophota bacterium]
MQLKEIYSPIRNELTEIERLIRFNIENSPTASIVKIGGYLLRSGGKRLRPALVTLSARATLEGDVSASSKQVLNIASAVELIHLASLLHDDVIDHSKIRHNKPTVNAKWGEDVAIVLGDYLYSIGFDLISSCRNPDVLDCISRSTRMMCEGELTQVCERDNLDILKERYITIVKNKTANLFAACCQAGVLAVGRHTALGMLKEYGLNFGIAFQIVDDSLDLIGEIKDLGKVPGADFKMGELTMPILNLLSETEDKRLVRKLIAQKDSKRAFKDIRKMFINSGALTKTIDDVHLYAEKAKKSLRGLADSSFKHSLCALADFAVDRIKA